MIELLKEARDELAKFRPSYYARELIARIDTELAKPAPDAKAIAKRIEQEMCGIEGEPGRESVVLDIDQAAALIESRRVVPRAISDIAGKLEEAIDSEDWNEAKSVLNDLWDLRDDGYKVEG